MSSHGLTQSSTALSSFERCAPDLPSPALSQDAVHSKKIRFAVHTKHASFQNQEFNAHGNIHAMCAPEGGRVGLSNISITCIYQSLRTQKLRRRSSPASLAATVSASSET